MTIPDKTEERQSAIAQALIPFHLPPETAAARAIEIEGIFRDVVNPELAKASVWEILGRLDEYATVPVQIRGAAVDAAIKAWGKVSR